MTKPTECTDRQTQHGIIRENMTTGAIVYTDDRRSYCGLKQCFHATVEHSVGAYVRYMTHTNGIESF